jgi:hypothetical protein
LSPLIALAALLLTFLVPAAPAQAAAISGGTGFQDESFGSVSAPTGQKPESKLWHAGGTWYGVLWNVESSPKRYEIHRFNLATQGTDPWTPTGTVIDARRNSQADTLFDSANNKLYVLTHIKDTDTSETDLGIKFQRFGFNPTTKTYTLEANKSIVSKRAEAAVLDKDSTGTLWVTFTDTTGSGRSVYVSHSTTSDTTWLAPYVIPVAGANNLSTDDISTLVAYGDAGGRKVGVLWSNQAVDALYFASHVDGAADSAWTRTTLCEGTLCPDDHLNIKSIDADTSGHIYAAVKTSLNDKSPKVGTDPLIVIYKLNTAGGWSSTTAWTVAQDLTRAIVVIDSQNREVHTFAAGPCCSGGTVWTKKAPLDALSFPTGFGTKFIETADPLAEPVNNPTSTKQSVNGTTGLLVLAGVDRTKVYVHNYLTLPGGGTPPPVDTTAPTVTTVTPAAGATGVATNSTATATFSEAVTGVSGTTFTLTTGGTTVPATVTMNAANTTATLTPTAALAASTTYTATVKGGSTGVKDTAGNALAADRVWTFTTAAVSPPSGGGDTVTLSATADTYGASAAATTNYGTAQVLGVDASSAEVSYLKYDLGPHAGKTVTSATLQIRATTSGSAGTQNVKLVTDDSWTETGLTYNARPALGASLGTVGPTSSNTNYTVTLNAGTVQGQLGGPLSLGMDSASSDGLDLGSRESTTPPTLVLTFSSGGTPPPGDTTAPTVTAVTPAENATGVAANTTVTATFSEDVTGVSGTTFTLTSGGTTVPATVSYNAASTTATLTPSAALAASTTYTATVNGGATEVKDAADNPAVDKSWTFTTAAATPPSGGGETVTLTATADTYGAASAPTTNYGTNVLLAVDSSSAAVSYLKFDLGPHAGKTVTSATLQIRATTSGSVGTQNVKLVTDDSWTESGLTYNARPALGTALGTLGPTSRDTTYPVTLNAGSVQGQLGGALSLGLDSTSSDGVDLGSRETAIPPRLVLTFS